MNILLLPIIYLIANLNTNSMNNCYIVKNQKELFDIIKKEKLDILSDSKTVSKFRTSRAYYLDDGSIIIVPNVVYPKCDGLWIKNKLCFDQLLESDYLPVENPDKSFLEFDKDRIVNISNSITYFTQYLNNRIGLQNLSVDKGNYKYYYDGVLKLYNSKNYSPKDALALLIVAGEVLRIERNAKWVLKKEDGVFNPIYEPAILLDDDRFIDLSFVVLNRLSNNLEYDNFYMNNILNAIPTGHIEHPVDDESYIFLPNNPAGAV